jgi:xanthine/CO dehydrogenase XdhC/CoxF family maturation factor
MAPHVPPPHVWTAIAAATSSRSHRSRWSAYFSFGWQPALATAMTLLLSTGLWWVGARLATVTVPPSALAEPGSDDARAGLAQEEAHYTTAIATLEDVTNAERTALDPDTAVVLQTSMTVIDDAIAESRAALDTDPESEIAQESLFEALHRKVVVLQRTLALINEMRKGNPDGAARIISELNQ